MLVNANSPEADRSSIYVNEKKSGTSRFQEYTLEKERKKRREERSNNYIFEALEYQWD
jgi:hypothetical protein